MNRVEVVWDKMNESERFGLSFGLFPSWILKYKLNKEEKLELMDRSQALTKIKA